MICNKHKPILGIYRGHMGFFGVSLGKLKIGSKTRGYLDMM